MADSPTRATLSADAAVSAWLEGCGARTSSIPTGFGAMLLECWQRARAGVPGDPIEPRAFLRHVGERSGPRPSGDLVEVVGALRWEELYLAYAAAHGCGHALRRLESRYLSDAVRALGSRGVGAADRDDVFQRVRTIMLGTGSGTDAKLLTFRGQGPLSRWNDAVAFRASRPPIEQPLEGLVPKVLPHHRGDVARGPRLQPAEYRGPQNRQRNRGPLGP